MISLDPISIIEAKRDGRVLSRDQLQSFVSGFISGAIPDYQMSALLMAMCLKGMELAETTELTRVMVESGVRLDLSAIPGMKVDKHSSGGVGDKTTLVVAPLAAAAGVPVPKLSGRSLGHTGGTLDKLESIPGLTTGLDSARFVRQVAEIGLAIAGQSAEMVPADKKMYALRDVTGTVDCLSLITSSIASKKIAGGADAIVLDVKCGSGAFMRDLNHARLLGTWLVDVIEAFGRLTIALITDMEQPLGLAVGNSLEVVEAIEVLQGDGPEDVREIALELAARMLVAGGNAELTPARLRVEALLDDGSALAKFGEMVAAQEGDSRVVEDPYRVLPRASSSSVVRSDSAGFITAVDAREVGRAAGLLGAGRSKTGELIDRTAGITLLKKVGDRVETSEELAKMEASDPALFPGAETLLAGAFRIGSEAPSKRPLILNVIK